MNERRGVAPPAPPPAQQEQAAAPPSVQPCRRRGGGTQRPGAAAAAGKPRKGPNPKATLWVQQSFWAEGGNWQDLSEQGEARSARAGGSARAFAAAGGVAAAAVMGVQQGEPSVALQREARSGPDPVPAQPACAHAPPQADPLAQQQPTQQMAGQQRQQEQRQQQPAQRHPMMAQPEQEQLRQREEQQLPPARQRRQQVQQLQRQHLQRQQQQRQQRGPPQCSNCGSTSTSQWRWHPGSGERVCNGCHWYSHRHGGQMRPTHPQQHQQTAAGVAAGLPIPPQTHGKKRHAGHAGHADAAQPDAGGTPAAQPEHPEVEGARGKRARRRQPARDGGSGEARPAGAAAAEQFMEAGVRRRQTTRKQAAAAATERLQLARCAVAGRACVSRRSLARQHTMQRWRLYCFPDVACGAGTCPNALLLPVSCAACAMFPT
mgnify:CR=1 FL=1